MKNAHKGFASLVLLIIVGVVAVGSGAYYYAQKNEVNEIKTETQNSEVSTNAQMNTSVCVNAADKDLCFSNEAVVKNDVNLCNSAPNKDYCLGQFGGAKGNVAICDTVTAIGTKEICYSQAAATNNDIAICSKTKSPAGCYIGVAIATKNPTICTAYNVNGDKDGLSEVDCLTKVAKAANNVSICTSIKDAAWVKLCVNWVEKGINPYTVN
ncbi:MAG: hypothetical protein K0S38_657 [Candidatus Paceibacter sp.]|jgi:hypothetical protein|nr:hypothetical protein [Candidatus Paceibacter sp.]